MATTKKMTARHWNTLSRDSRRRALTYVFPMMPALVDMLLDEKPTKISERGSWWNIVFNKVRIPNDSWYKTCVNGFYLM